MIYCIATLETTADCRDELLAVFRELVPQVLAEKGCIEYTPTIDMPTSFSTQGPLRNNVVTMVEKWEDLAALEAHNQMPHMARFRKQIEPLRVSLSLQILKLA
jgi:quinol monooxygenase YgiN